MENTFQDRHFVSKVYNDLLEFWFNFYIAFQHCTLLVGVTYPDGCTCNVNNDIIDWLDKYGCTKRFTQIISDLKPFEKIDFDILYPIAEEKLFRNYHSLSICDYVIKNNEVCSETS